MTLLIACTTTVVFAGGQTPSEQRPSSQGIADVGSPANGPGPTTGSVSSGSTTSADVVSVHPKQRPPHGLGHRATSSRGSSTSAGTSGSAATSTSARTNSSPDTSSSAGASSAGTSSADTGKASSTPKGSSGECVSQAQGIPQSGAYIGAAVSGSASLPSVERNTGRPVAIHRNYFMPNQVDNAIASVKTDLAAGRLPWISFKVPYSWADMAAGRGDAWAEALADKLATVGGPVWLAFHHEPEGDGNLQDWKRMQQHLAPIIHARTNNVAFTVILIAWNEFFGPNPEQHIDQVYPGSQYVDVLGMDVYNEYGAKSVIKHSLDPMSYFGVIGAWARAHQVPWAVAETGYTKKAAAADPDWLETAYRDLKAQGGIGLTYFDSSLHSIADWTLDDAVRADAFKYVLGQSDRICT